MALISADLCVSLDGVAAGPDQTADHPNGSRVGFRLQQWIIDGGPGHRADGQGLRIFEGVPDQSWTPVDSRATPQVIHTTWRHGRSS